MKREKIKTILNNKISYIVLGILTSLYVLLNLNTTSKSSLNIDNREFRGTLNKLVIKDNKATFTIKFDNENLVCNYYLKEDETIKYEHYPLGSKVFIKGTLNVPKNNTVPNTFNYKKYLYYHDTYYTCTIDEIDILKTKMNIFYKIKNAVIKRIMTYDIKDYMYTLIIGDKSLMDEEVYETFKYNGVTHLFAISGMHIGLFTGIILLILKKCHLKENFRYIVTVLFIWTYAFLAGFSPSVLRACLLFTLLSINKIFKLEIDTIKVLLLTGFILILTNYKIIMDIGFIYSFTITFGLMHSKKYLERHKIIGTSLIATLYSIPITISNFYKLNLFSLINNLVFVPLVTVLVYPLVLLSFVFRFLEPLAKISIWILEFINTTAAKIEIFNVVIPKPSIIFIIIFYLLLIFKFNKRPTRVGIALFVLVFITKATTLLDINYHVEFLDVGQGDSILIRSKQNKEVILIDTGGVVSYTGTTNYHVASNTITYLNSLGIDEIDYLVITHGDYDHMGESEYLIDNINIKNVVFNKDGYNDLEIELIKTLNKKKIKYSKNINEIPFGEGKIYFLDTKIYDNENDNSNVLYLKLENFNFLFMGDAGEAKEKDILEKYSLKDINFLKVGHHGSDTSTSKNFIKKINPDISIISVGKNNRYGHPKDSVLNTLSNSKVYRTDLEGTIEISLNKSKYKIRTYPP